MSKLVLKIFKRRRRSDSILNRKEVEAPSSPPLDQGIPGRSDYDIPPPSGKNAPPENELRKEDRQERVTKVRYKMLVPITGQGFTQDVSKDGFRLFLDHQVPAGAVIEMKFKDPIIRRTQEHPIGKIMWRKDHEAGVKVLRK